MTIFQNVSQSVKYSLSNMDKLMIKIDYSMDRMLIESHNAIDRIFLCVYIALFLFFVVAITYVYSNCCATNTSRFKSKRDWSYGKPTMQGRCDNQFGCQLSGVHQFKSLIDFNKNFFEAFLDIIYHVFAFTWLV